MNDDSIKSMRLYSQVERIHNELEALGIDRESPLEVADISAFDQYHYHGTAAVDLAIARLGLTAESSVLEVGSGIGGPARYLAEQSGCQVTALELQADLNTLALELTARCSLSERVTHLCGDALQVSLERSAFDAVVSWLALYHIPEHGRLFARLFDSLKPGATLYIEDICSRGSFTPEEEELLRVRLYGNYTPSIAHYRQDLEEAGFIDIQTEDMSDNWAAFTHARLEAFRENKGKQEAVHGAATVADLESFYGAVDQLFQGGNLGGLRVLARKPT